MTNWYQHIIENPQLLKIDITQPKITDDNIPFSTMLDVIEEEEARLTTSAARWLALLANPTINEFTKDDIKMSFVVLMRQQELFTQMKNENLHQEENI